MKLKKSVRVTAACLVVFYLAVAVFISFSTSVAGLDEYDYALWQEALLTLLFLVGLPIAGISLSLWGAHIQSGGDTGGSLLPKELISMVAFFGGVSIALSPIILVVLGPEDPLLLKIVRGVLVASLVLPVAFTTAVVHGGSELVRKQPEFQGLARWRHRLKDRFVDSGTSTNTGF